MHALYPDGVFMEMTFLRRVSETHNAASRAGGSARFSRAHDLGSGGCEI